MIGSEITLDVNPQLSYSADRYYACQIQQLDANDKIFRTFSFSKKGRELQTFLNRTRLAYNMNRTQVLINFKLVDGKPL